MAFLGVLSAAPVLAQTESPESKPKLSVFIVDLTPSESSSAAHVRPFERVPLKPGRAVLSLASKKRFLFLSAAVYGAALADMHRTLEVRKNSWWYETDPLAKPFVRLPTPAYYVTGLALATGLNWMSWKMAHSSRWHRLAPFRNCFQSVATSTASNPIGFESFHASFPVLEGIGEASYVNSLSKFALDIGRRKSENFWAHSLPG